MFRKNKNIHSEDPFHPDLREVKHNKLNDTSYKLEWTESAFISGEEKEVVGKTFNFSRLKWVALGFGVFLLIILGRVGWLQVVQGEYYGAMAEGNRIRAKEIPSRRGIIYDRHNRPLVRNVANFILYFIPGDMPDKEQERNKVINEVVEILNATSTDILRNSSSKGKEIKEKISASEIKEKINDINQYSSRAYQPLFIADSIPYKQAMQLRLRSKEWGGVMLSNKRRREYILNTSLSTLASTSASSTSERWQEKEVKTSSFSHILGYTGKINKQELERYGGKYSALDYVGKTGIERYRENALKGEKGKKRVEVDALGKEKKIISKKEPRDGHNLILSLDSELQAKMQQVLSKHVQQIDSAQAAAGIAMDPHTGEVLSLVSIPAYNNNLFARGITSSQYKKLTDSPSNPLFNRAVTGEYPPGSTFKPVMAAAGLQEGIITDHTSFKSTGGIRVGKWFFPDWKQGGHGITDVRKAISQSVNTFFYYLGGGYNDFTGLGVDRIIDYSRKFGLGESTGIDLPQETSGFLPTKEWKKKEKGERWYIGDTYHLSIGQGFILTTPLQVTNYISVFANGGKLYEPFLVKEIRNTQGKLVERIDPEPLKKRVVEEENVRVVRQGMRQAVTNGSCRRLYDLSVKAAGKTGTAQWEKDKTPHSWFTGFAPYEDPEIVLTVLVEKGGESEEVAVPVAKEILEWYFDKRNKKDVE